MAASPPLEFNKHRRPDFDLGVPASREAEEYVIGSIILAPDALQDVIGFLRPQDFMIETLRWVYEAALALNRKGYAIDTGTIAEQLRQDGRAEDVGGIYSLIGMVSRVPTYLHIEHYGRIVHELAVRRRVISAGSDIARLAYDTDDLATLSSNVQQALSCALETAYDREMRSVSEVLQDEARRMDDDTPAGMPTGLTDLDRMIGGMKRGKLYVVGGRPGHGKTSLMLSILAHLCRDGKRAAVFSLEMTGEEVVQRLIGMTRSVNVKAIEDKSLDDAQLSRYFAGHAEIDAWKLLIDDGATGQLTADEIAAKCRRALRFGPLDLVIVDYLQLMLRDQTNRVAEMSNISRAMKQLAKAVNAPVLVGSQLTRAVEGRDGRRPNLHDLRESGQIEADADCVLLMYNERAADRKAGVAQSGKVEIDVAKQRNGPIGVVAAYFSAEHTRFGNLTKGEL